MTLGRDLARVTETLKKGASGLAQATCISVDWPNYLAVVNIAGGEVSVPMVGDAPYPGDTVWVGWLGQNPICLGPVPKATTGTVTGAGAAGFVTVLGDDNRSYTVPYTGTAPADNARVAMLWPAKGLLVGAMSADAPGVVPIAPPSSGGGGAPGGSSTGKMTFNPTESGTYNGSSWYGDGFVGCSASEQGAWFYGNQIADTIPDDATITVARIHIDEYFNRYPSSLARLGTHTLTSKSGAPNVTGTLDIPRGSGDRDIRMYADALKTGAAKGIGTNHGGWHKFSPKGTRNSGAIYMEWSL